MAVKTLKYNSTAQLTKHINARELRCKCGKQHDTMYDPVLLEQIETIMSLVKADKVLITSGFRCPDHDKAVGGNGRGQHTKGAAVDAKFVRNGSYISTKVISCIAQDLGMKGIANINADYTAIHLDHRATGKYYGNELKGTNTVTNNFYTYYNLTPEDVRLTDEPIDTPEGDQDTEQWDYDYDAAIKELQTILNQKGHRLKVDGIAGNNTLNAVKQYTIGRGDQGPLTGWTKRRLQSLKCSCTDTNSVDLLTVSAIRLFETMQKLPVNGVIAGNDWYALLK